MPPKQEYVHEPPLRPLSYKFCMRLEFPRTAVSGQISYSIARLIINTVSGNKRWVGLGDGTQCLACQTLPKLYQVKL